MPRRQKGKTAGPKRSFHCNICDARVRLPRGWNVGAAVRKHYWRRHPEAMQKAGRS